MDLTEINNVKSSSEVENIILPISTSPIIVADKDETLKSSNSPFILKLRVDTIYSEKDFDKFIKCVEKLVRFSYEYKEWVSYIIENLGYNFCAITEEVMGECEVVMHHHPINLYTICKAVISEFLSKNQSFCTFDVATKVIELHFQNKVGYVPLLSNLHEKYHNGFLNVPIELVHGDYKYILTAYKIDDQEYERILELCNIKLCDCKHSWKKDNYPGINK
jgi:hypothetical protein